MYNIKNVIENFNVAGDFIHAESYGEGHINDTFAVYLSENGKEYRVLLQRINHNVFHDIPGLMNNIYGVTEHLKLKIIENGGDPTRETLNIIKTKQNEVFYRDDSGNCWRIYVFLENATSFQSGENDSDIFNCGLAFGTFQLQLSDYDTKNLVETIPNFHNTVKRFEALKKAVENDVCHRANDVEREIDFAFNREKDAAEIQNQINDGTLPLRVTHNDTKLNNIMIDDKTGKGLCVIDLDTVMPGAVCYDFGDFIRFAANTAPEDETDLSKVNLNLHVVDVFSKGYLGLAKDFLTPTEVDSLALGAKLMTYECGLRFLTDYLEGDKYFKIHKEHHNLDRCRTQFKLVEEIENNMSELQKIVRKYI